MNTSWRRGGCIAVLALTALLLWQPNAAQAHPQLMGRWSAPVPTGGSAVYDFGPGEYIGGGVWRGPYTYIVSGCPVINGIYELRLFTGTQGTVGLQEGPVLATAVANVDLGERVLTFRSVNFLPDKGKRP